MTLNKITAAIRQRYPYSQSEFNEMYELLAALAFRQQGV